MVNLQSRLCWSIPACAGEPEARNGRHYLPTVYPRVCGGANPVRHYRGSKLGLSPRVRGSPVRDSPSVKTLRSIPACAGEPHKGRQMTTQRWVYPRVCGGATNKRNDMDDTKGLSPRVRGSRDRLSRGRGTRGSIPACAGEPAEVRDRTRPLRVYPRVCGGAWWNGTEWESAHGLSPRVRGSRVAARNRQWKTRSIPACAGEPRLTPAMPLRFRVYPRVCGGAQVAEHVRHL